MHSITRPPFGVEHVIRASAPLEGDVDLADLSDDLVNQEREYIAAAESGSLWSFVALPGRFDSDQEVAIHDAYVSRLRSKGSDARAFYDYLRTMAHGGVCPNCMARDASALDHVLPRAEFPTISLQPTNLVPICADCNLIKLNRVASSAETGFLHSYFDDLGELPWLAADVVEEDGAPLLFRIIRPTGWDDLLFSRMAKHFDRYHLAQLYGAKAGGLLGNHRVALESHLRDSPAGVESTIIRRELIRLAESHASNRSLWQSAAFRAWSSNDWFCEGGWRTKNDVAVLNSAYQAIRVEIEKSARANW